MNTILFRVGLLLLHILLNVVVVSYLTRFDLTGSWLALTAFVLLLFFMLALLIRHIISFINYAKHNSK
ncbi:MAG: hypothetical protein K0Q66_1173 [Chitinophagaceae bacterium]|jgi:hypothetical protein|nr:hypothetical protein [Chitinophagaceae bacterium]